jgi:glycosyltransferase involved in cell wall biosynthesis
MKIIIASAIIPFSSGYKSLTEKWFEQRLREYGHQVEFAGIPFSFNYKELISQITALRLYHLENECERLICTGVPSYLIPHPSKYIWFLNHYCEILDLWDTEPSNTQKDSERLAVREYIMRADDAILPEAKKIYTNSQIMSKRLMDFSSIKSKPLYPPVLKPEQFFCDSYGDYIFYLSRICSSRRQLLAVQAMEYTKTSVKLLLVGKPDDPAYMETIFKYIRDHSLEKKVVILNEFLTEEQKTDYFAKCLAALYIPCEKYFFGFPALEAYYSRKPVVTCTDSGGTDELIIDGENGLQINPDPKMIAESFDKFYTDRQITEKMGSNGFKRIKELDITWDNVVRKFTQ